MKLRLYSQILLGLFLIASFCTSNAGPKKHTKRQASEFVSAAFNDNGDITVIFIESDSDDPVVKAEFDRNEIWKEVKKHHKTAEKPHYLAAWHNHLVVGFTTSEESDDVYRLLKFEHDDKNIYFYSDEELKLTKKTKSLITFNRVNIMGSKLTIPLTAQNEQLTQNKWLLGLDDEKKAQLEKNIGTFENDPEFEEYEWCWTSETEQYFEITQEEGQE